MGAWFSENVEWMHWTLPSALFFGGLFVTLTAMSIWDRLSPSPVRKGFLPMPTTRGDRLFIGIMCAIGIHLLWLAALGTDVIWGALLIAIGFSAVLARWG